VSLSGAATSAALAAGAGLAATLIRSLGSAAVTAYKEGTRARDALASTGTVESVAEIDRRHATLANIKTSRPQNLSSSDALKVQTALMLRDYAVAETRTLKKRIEALSLSRSLDQSQHASDALLEVARQEHHNLLVRRVAEASMLAARKAGFDKVNTTQRGDQIRVVATNRSGQALVTEIDATLDGDLSMATEAVGIRDGSCHEVLDLFDASLEAEGVIAGPPRRSPTGGVCQLATARQAIRELYGAAGKTRSRETSDKERTEAVTSKKATTRRSRNQVSQRRGR
jgi:hypothetical protein